MPAEPYLRFDDQISGVRRRFAHPIARVQAIKAEQVHAAFDEIDLYLQQGFSAAGYVAYEAAAAFGLSTHQLHDYPLVDFLITPPPTVSSVSVLQPAGAPELTSQTSITDYLQAVAEVKGSIERGDVYQVNLTTALAGPEVASPAALYGALLAKQGARYSAFADLGSLQISSLSPELFFSLRDGRIYSEPMKGTRPAAQTPAANHALGVELLADPKERAENIMIVDLMRNDLARLTNSPVRTDALLQLRQFPTFNTLTSTVSADLDHEVRLAQIFGTIFPAGSITGAPKESAMKIIKQLESGPRGIYCGAIGWILPDPVHRYRAQFSVAIRTLVHQENGMSLDHGSTTYGVGSGITWSSDPTAEWAELTTKTAFLRS